MILRRMLGFVAVVSGTRRDEPARTRPALTVSRRAVRHRRQRGLGGCVARDAQLCVGVVILRLGMI
jgi:hypothetical protein